MIGRGNVYLWSTIAEEPPQFWRFRLQVSPILAASVPATGGETTKQNINQSSSSELH